MDSFLIQTPPPTRGSVSQRKHQQPYAVGQATPSMAISGAAITTPHTTGHIGTENFATHTPSPFASLQFSPDLFTFANQGSATGPALPDTGMFWGQGNNMNTMDMNDPFGPSAHGVDVPSGWQPLENSTEPPRDSTFYLPSTYGPGSQPSNTWISCANDLAHTAAFPQSGLAIPTTSGVDPSLLFSFSSALDATDSLSIKPQLAQMSLEHGNRQPYEHQTRELSKEREIARKAKQYQSRTTTVSSSTPFDMENRPTLQRSKTDSGLRRLNRLSLGPRSAGLGSNQPNIPRHPSPLKRQNESSLSAIPELTTRPRTRLVVDATGHARTETEPSDDDVASGTSAKAQYPGLWAEGDSDSDSDHGHTSTTSRASSFALPPEPERHAKHARLNGESYRIDASKLPRSTSSASLNNTSPGMARNAYIGGLARSNSRKRRGSPSRRYSMPSFGDSADGPEAHEADTAAGAADAAGDAQGALKKVMEDRMRRQGTCTPSSPRRPRG